jgi:hypothetical protein
MAAANTNSLLDNQFLLALGFLIAIQAKAEHLEYLVVRHT